MTEPLTDQDQQLLDEVTTTIVENTKRMDAAADRMDAATEAAQAVDRTLDRLLRNYRRTLWPIAFLTGGLGGATAALVLDFLLS